MNTTHHDTKVTAIIAVTEPNLIVRGPDFYEDGMYVWIGPRAAVSLPMERGIGGIHEILAMPRTLEVCGHLGAKGWSRLSASYYGAEVRLFPGHGTDDDAPTAEESWDLLTEAVSQ